MNRTPSTLSYQSQGYVFLFPFPVVVYGCERWTIKNTESRRIDALELWCWRRLLRVPWIARSNQPILKEINFEYSLEGLMLKLKLQYFGHLTQRADYWKRFWCWERFEAEELATENEMIGWCHRLSGQESEQTVGDNGEHRSLGSHSPWGRRELDMT